MSTIAEASLTRDEQRLLGLFVAELEARLGNELRSVWLFGSRARSPRTLGEYSDVDLLVIAEDASWGGKLRVHGALDEAASALGLDAVAWSFSVHVNSPAWLAERRGLRSFFVAEIDRDKIVLYGPP